MPSNGQTCNSCLGTCCDARIHYPDDLTLKEYPHNKVMWCDWFTLRKRGFTIKVGTGNKMCSSKAEDGCSLHGTEWKPLFCRTYYCYGKYWKEGVFK